jgi:hypothetical protein
MKPENEKPFHTEWIERYLGGELQGEELEQFIHRLHTDAAFQQEVALQRSIVAQAHQVGREELQKQLKSLHRQLGFAEKKNKYQPQIYYAVAATLLLLLVAAFVFYFSYRPLEKTPAISGVKEEVLSKQPVLIRLQVKGQQPNMGFSGTYTDSTTTVLLYPAQSPAYRFDDTLRLYGTFEAHQLTLQYDQAKEQYTLLIDSLAYPLQRYRPKQALPRAP